MKFLTGLGESEEILGTIFVTLGLLLASVAHAQAELQSSPQAAQILAKKLNNKPPQTRHELQSHPWTVSTTEKLSRRLLPKKSVPPPQVIAMNQDKGPPHDDELLLPDLLPKSETTTAGAPPPEIKTFGVDLFLQFDSAPEGASQNSLQRGSAQFEYFAQLNYSPFTNTTIFLRPTWNTVFAPDTTKVTLNTTPGEPTTKVGDTILGVSQNKLLTWGGVDGGSFNVSARYYAPTAEADRTTGQEAEFSVRGNVTQPLNSWFTLLFDTKAWWTIQSQTFYVDPNDPNNLKANFDKEITTYFTGVVRLSSIFSFNQSIGVDYSWMLGSYDPGMTAPQGYTSLYVDSSLAAKVAKGVEFRIGVNDEPSTNVEQPAQAFGPNDYCYYASVFFSF